MASPRGGHDHGEVTTAIEAQVEKAAGGAWVGR